MAERDRADLRGYHDESTDDRCEMGFLRGDGNGGSVGPWWNYDTNFFRQEMFDSCLKAMHNQALQHDLEYHSSAGRGDLSDGSSIDDLFDELCDTVNGRPIRSTYHFHKKLRGGSLRSTIANFDNGSDCRWAIWTRGMIEVDSTGRRKVFVRVATTDEKDLERVHEVLVRTLHVTPEPGAVLTLHQANPNQPITTRRMGVIRRPLERDNYSSEVLAGYDEIVSDLEADEPVGRLSIVTGVTGTGKTYLIRGMISEVNAIFLLVPPKFVPHLGDPGIVNCLLDLREAKDRPIVLVLEEADVILSRRMDTNMDAIMSALNLGDGIMGDMLDARLVMTSNVAVGSVDDAIVRSGRLNVRMDVGPLEPEHATRVFRRLLPESTAVFEEPTTLSDVYATARSLGWKPPKRSHHRVGDEAVIVRNAPLESQF